MRLQLTMVAFIAASCMTLGDAGQHPVPWGVTLVAGNEANGKDYQPTPNEVRPRERAAGIIPPAAEQRATNQELERTDKNLLRQQGMSTRSVPNFTGTQ